MVICLLNYDPYSTVSSFFFWEITFLAILLHPVFGEKGGRAVSPGVHTSAPPQGQNRASSPTCGWIHSVKSVVLLKKIEFCPKTGDGSQFRMQS